MLKTSVLIASLALTPATIVLCGGAQPSRRAESAEYTASKVGRNCTTDKCEDNEAGCASCVELKISLPPNAWVTKTHCYTNAHYPDDYARHDLHEVTCGSDVSWSTFETPTVSVTAGTVEVRTTYHNRSSDRTRDVKLRVDWHELAQTGPETKD